MNLQLAISDKSFTNITYFYLENKIIFDVIDKYRKKKNRIRKKE